MRNLFIATLLAASAATPAWAQDADAQEAGPLSGLRATAIVGYDRPQANGGNIEGVVYGGVLGYDHQRGNVVAGVELEATHTSAGECRSDVFDDGDEFCADFKRDLYAGFRIGAVINDNGLIYAKAGYTNQRVGASVDLGDGDVVDGKDNLDGFRVGGGGEFGFGTNLFARVEYRYSNYKDEIEKHQGIVGVGVRF